MRSRKLTNKRRIIVNKIIMLERHVTDLQNQVHSILSLANDLQESSSSDDEVFIKLLKSPTPSPLTVSSDDDHKIIRTPTASSSSSSSDDDQKMETPPPNNTNQPKITSLNQLKKLFETETETENDE